MDETVGELIACGGDQVENLMKAEGEGRLIRRGGCLHLACSGSMPQVRPLHVGLFVASEYLGHSSKGQRGHKLWSAR